MTGDRSEESTRWDGEDWEVYGVDGLRSDPQEVRRGVNYVAGLRRARAAADRLAAALSVNVPEAVRGVHAEVVADGTAVVWLGFDVATAERVAGLLGGGDVA